MNSTSSSHRRELIYHGQRIDLYHVAVSSRKGGTENKEFIDHPGAVVILPVLADGSVCLIKNWRYSADTILWELPAGTLERGEQTLFAAQRELQEETGFTAQSWQLLAQFWVSPGVYGEKMWLYLARDLTSGKQTLDATEQIEPEIVKWDKAIQMALQGIIQDAKTLCGILLWDRMRHEADNT